MGLIARLIVPLITGLTQPLATAGIGSSTPPKLTYRFLTEAGDLITTEAGDRVRTETP